VTLKEEQVIILNKHRTDENMMNPNECHKLLSDTEKKRNCLKHENFQQKDNSAKLFLLIKIKVLAYWRGNSKIRLTFTAVGEQKTPDDFAKQSELFCISYLNLRTKILSCSNTSFSYFCCTRLVHLELLSCAVQKT
jgi:hypothetical protein